MKPVDVRSQLVKALRLDLVGPENGTDLEAEVLPQAPSRWYLTGFLVPLEAGEVQKSDETSQDELNFGGGDREAADLFDVWSQVAHDYHNLGTALQYNPAEVGAAKP